MNDLITKANVLLRKGNFDYAFCGGFAIELFLDKEIRGHGDIDVSAFWSDRNEIIVFMQSIGWQVYEMCGGGIAHHITDVADQMRIKRNIFCFSQGCDLVKLTPQHENEMYTLDFDSRGQKKLDFIEFLFNDKDNTNFLYARNKEISLALSDAILFRDDIPYLTPELVLLYKSTDTEREGYQLDYDYATARMNERQKAWLANALQREYPQGHVWI